MKLTTERLLEIVDEPFSYLWLDGIERTLVDFVPLTPNGRVAVYVVRRICWDLKSHFEANEPIEVLNHNAHEGAVAGKIRELVRAIARNTDPSWGDLALLVQISEKARIAN